MLRPYIVRLLAVVMLVGMTAGLASAHAELNRSEPAAGATVAAAPQSVTLYFSQALDITKSSITVVRASGPTVSQGSAELLANDPKAMRVALGSNLGPGTYTVRWTNLSAEDGEAEEDEFTFTVSAEAASAPASATPAQQLPSTGSEALRLPVLLLALFAVILTGLGLALRRTGTLGRTGEEQR